MFLNNPAYTLMESVDKYKIYIPSNETEYHMSRHVEATRQSIYAGAGANEEVINAHMEAIIDRCNMAMDLKTRTTDIAAIATALQYRTKYPVDQHCGVRMGCILSFLEVDEDGKLISEDPNTTEIFWLQKKEKLAFDYPNLYSFFLTWGATNVRKWSGHLDTLEDREYLRNRMETLRSILPKDLLNLSTM